MPILLKPEQEKIIESQISKGRFANADQVINTALHLRSKLSNEYQEWLEETAKKIDVAIAEIESGDTLDGETVVSEILQRFKNAREEK